MIRVPKRARLRIAVLAGGQSAERGVSLASGQHVAESLARLGHWVVGIDPVDSPWDESEWDELHAAEHGRVAVNLPAIDPANCRFLAARLRDVDWSAIDACFLALHGGAGEDGRVQRFFEELRIPFTGPGSHSAAVAMSKQATKGALRAAGVSTPHEVVFDADMPLAVLSERAAALGFPVVVKPDGQGSSLGVGLARDREAIAACREEVLQYGDRGLIEPFIAGREFTVALLGREALPIVEVLVDEPVFSFAAKYDQAVHHFRVAQDMPGDEETAIRGAAVAAAAALDTRGLVRVDLRLDESGRPWVLELNAIPGLTQASLAPLAARHAGWEMPEFCERLLRNCLDEVVTDGRSRRPVAEMLHCGGESR
ncbi:MAG TPA: ATP-grasp domain-containing protein [Pirellulales bacterium]|nr:ATP-grasp domain-containing protein [Pirellulales bacterium]